MLAPTAQAQSASGTNFELYGFVMADMIFEFGQSNPDWFDALRPSKLPAVEDEFGKDGRFYAGIRQSKIGAKSSTPTGLGTLKTMFEFDLYGVGVDAGQTTIRPRHMWGEIGQVGAGQTDSPFMDGDVFPNILEYWGPAGMLYFRQPQVRWMPIRGNSQNRNSKASIALERPGASGDQGNYADRIELQNVRARFPLPDLSAEYRHGTGWGYVELAGILREIRLDDLLTDDQFNLNKNMLGWGLSLSSNYKFAKSDVVRFQAVYGEGIQNYFNDAPADVGPKINVGDPIRPIEATALPVLGLVFYLDHSWNKMLSTAIGYSRVDITNSSGQAPTAFRDGQYASLNLLATPAKNIMLGGEFQWARRDNFNDGFHADDFKMQFGFKYNFGVKFENGTVAQK
ncbi:MAG TPA: DcaP family trimeric outer membrane transporter [Gemmatimonadaceae bacterium]|nr:DcaP family trimeric outer membrane transporter [Gemmatimonadaceae bacterium]